MLLLLLSMLAVAAMAQQQQPNIILVIANSIGKGDLLAASDKMGYSTPAINKMANDDGVRLNKYYVDSESSPTRAALLTGRYAFNLGLQRQLVPGTPAALPLEVPTLAEMLQAVGGYATHMIGTWDLGYARLQNTPTSRGYSTFYGHLGPQVDYWDKTLYGGFDFWDEIRGQTLYKRPAWEARGNHSTKQYQTRTREIIETHVKQGRTEPLFITIAHQAAKYTSTLQGKLDSRCKKSSVHRRPYCTLIMGLEDAMADLRKVLEEQKQWQRTIIVFTTDSGGMVPFHGFVNGTSTVPKQPGSVGSNFPLRGSKTTLFEGGVNGVCFVTGGALPVQYKRKQITNLVHAVDVPALLLGLVQPQQLFRFQLDGQSPFSKNSKPEAAAAARTEIPIHIESKGKQYSSIRMGKYKLIIGRASRGGNELLPWGEDGDGYWRSDGRGLQRAAPARKPLSWLFPYKLFDLDVDPLERVNLVYNQTAWVREGQRRIKQRVKEVSGMYREPVPNYLHPLAWPTLHNGVWMPFLGNHQSVVRLPTLEQGARS